MKQKSLGGFWPNKKKQNPRAPQHLGNIVLQYEHLRDLFDIASRSGAARLNIAGWVNEKNGERFLSIEAQPAPMSVQPSPGTTDLNDYFGEAQ